MATEFLSVSEFQKPIWTIDSYFGRFRRNDLNSKTSGLDHCSSCKVGACESGRKTQIVFNTARHSGLSTGRFPLDHHRSQTFAGAIDGGSKSGWTTADDCKIVESFGSASFESGVFGQIREGRLFETLAIREKDGRSTSGF